MHQHLEPFQEVEHDSLKRFSSTLKTMMNNENPRTRGHARLYASGATALVIAVVGTLVSIIHDMAQSDAGESAGDAIGHLILFIPNFLGAWIAVLLIIFFHQYFLGFFRRAMPPRCIDDRKGKQPKQTDNSSGVQ